MQSAYKRGIKISCLFILGALLAVSTFLVPASAEPEDSAFFSQGQSVLDPGDAANSRERAIQDFQVQAVGQAVSVILSPSKMAGELPAIQEKIFSGPERYVNDYRLFSETSAEGAYRVAGQVTVSMESLKRDLIQHGIFTQAQQTDAIASVSNTQGPAIDNELKDEQASEESTRGLVISKPEVLWAVVENWEGKWYLPTDLRDRSGLIASSVHQETHDFNWSILLARSNELQVNEQGNVSLTQAVNLAKKLGVRSVVAGTITHHSPGEGEPGLLAVHLRLLDVSSGRLQGEIRKEVPLNEESPHETALALASLMVPDLDHLLKKPIAAVDVPKSAAPMVEETGEWTLRVRSNQQIAYWEAIDRILRERFKSFQVKSLEFGGDEGVIRLTGIDGSALESLDGAVLPGGVQIQASSVPSQANTLVVTFIRTELNSVEP